MPMKQSYAIISSVLGWNTGTETYEIINYRGYQKGSVIPQLV